MLSLNSLALNVLTCWSGWPNTRINTLPLQIITVHFLNKPSQYTRVRTYGKNASIKRLQPSSKWTDELLRCIPGEWSPSHEFRTSGRREWAHCAILREPTSWTARIGCWQHKGRMAGLLRARWCPVPVDTAHLPDGDGALKLPEAINNGTWSTETRKTHLHPKGAICNILYNFMHIQKRASRHQSSCPLYMRTQTHIHTHTHPNKKAHKDSIKK